MIKFTIIGLSDNASPSFEDEVTKQICSARVFSGGIRHLEIVKKILPVNYQWIMVRIPVGEVIEEYLKHDKIVLFVSGDPMFYSLTGTIIRKIKDIEIKLYPAFNSLQLLSHAALLPYHDMVAVSLTGRSWDDFDRRIIEGEGKIGILTDKNKSPDKIALRLLNYGYDNYYMVVGENLGNRQLEKISKMTLQEASLKKFCNPNCVIIVKNKTRLREFGIADNKFKCLDNRDKMITKRGIRLISLSMLNLWECKCFWDIGFCTGSVSIEAKLQFPHLKIFAFEKREEGKTLMEINSKRFGAMGIEVITGDFNETDISLITAPDAVFIGGHGGKLDKVVKRAAGVLSPKGTIVFNSVSRESKDAFYVACDSCGMKIVENMKVKVDDNNTIDVIKAKFSADE